MPFCQLLAYSPTGMSTRRSYAALDGLRFLSAAAVIICHSFQDVAISGGSEAERPLNALIVHAGRFGVDTFFSISGFLIAGILLDERASRGRVDLKRFYIRRTLRIWPNYYAALLIGFGVAAVLGARGAHAFGYEPGHALFVLGLPKWLLFVGNWGPAYAPAAVAVLWSVCVEEQFYVWFPLALACVRGPYPAFTPVALGLLAALASRLPQFSWWPPYYNTIGHADNILLGVALAQAFRWRPELVKGIFSRAGVAGELAVLLALAFLVINLTRMERLAYGRVVTYLGSGLLSTCLVGLMAFGQGPLASLLSARLPRALGNLTYATYCFHWYVLPPVWRLSLILNLGTWPAAIFRAAIALPLSFGVGYLCWITYERRILRLKDRFTSPQP